MLNVAPLYCTIKKIQRFEDRVIWRVYGRFSRTIMRDYAAFFSRAWDMSTHVVSLEWSFMHTLCPYRTVPWHKGQVMHVRICHGLLTSSRLLSACGIMNIAIHCVCVNLPRALTYRNQQWHCQAEPSPFIKNCVVHPSRRGSTSLVPRPRFPTAAGGAAVENLGLGTRLRQHTVLA